MMKPFLVLLVAMALAACSPKGGSEYLGKWRGVQYTQYSMEIERNGDNFLAKMTTPVRGEEGKYSTTEVPAIFKDGQLQVAGAFGPVNITYIQKRDVLIMPGLGASEEFKRVK